MVRLVLASASPRRRALLEGLGLQLEVQSANVPERLDPDDVAASVMALAERKAEAVAQTLDGDAFVIGADTVGLHRGRIMGKPRDDADAVRILSTLAGDRHDVITGVAVIAVRSGAVGERRVARSRTVVHFHPLPDETIQAYVATGEPRGKAAAYAIQGMGGAFVSSINGSYHDVVGLPIDITLACLHDLGYPLPRHLVIGTGSIPTSDVS